MDVQPHLLNLSAYINQNLEKDLPLSSLAKRVGLSPFHFHRKFGAYFGESLHQHIKRLRLERAAYALIHESTPVRQIAQDSGYKTVSAFSHAFSGFAGESPTRYRSQAVVRRDGESGTSEAIDPSWVGQLPPQAIAFLRAKGNGEGTQHSIVEAIGRITSLVGPLPPREAGRSDSPADDDGRFAFIVATSDLYGLTRKEEYRLDVGVDADRVPPDRATALGTQTLPGGLHARFDFNCTPDELLGHLFAATKGTRSTKRRPRLSQYFLRFDGVDAKDDGENAPRDFRFFIPLAD